MKPPLHLDRRNAGASTLPLACVHGWGMNLVVFDALRDALPDVESHALDLPGHGRSPWNPARADFESQLEEVLAALPERCVLLGWSLGGQLAMQIARREPDRVAALVLVSSTPRFAQSADWLHGMDAGELANFGRHVEQDWRQTLSEFTWLQLRGSRNAATAQQRVEQALATHGAPHPEALRANLGILATLDLRDQVDAIRQPALLIAGQNDRVTPPDATRWLAERMPDARFALIPRAGHASFISHTEEFVALIRPFLAANGGAS